MQGRCLVCIRCLARCRQFGETGHCLLRWPGEQTISVVTGTDARSGARLHSVTAKEHDDAMSFIQALRHFTTYAYGYHLFEEKLISNVCWR